MDGETRAGLLKLAKRWDTSQAAAVGLLVRKELRLPPFDHHSLAPITHEELVELVKGAGLGRDNPRAAPALLPVPDEAHNGVLVCSRCEASLDEDGTCLSIDGCGTIHDMRAVGPTKIVPGFGLMRADAPPPHSDDPDDEAAEAQAEVDALARRIANRPPTDPVVTERVNQVVTMGTRTTETEDGTVQVKGFSKFETPTPPPQDLGPVVRNWTDADAPPWTKRVGQDLVDGEIVDPAAEEALRLWRHGVDVIGPAVPPEGGVW